MADALSQLAAKVSIIPKRRVKGSALRALAVVTPFDFRDQAGGEAANFHQVECLHRHSFPLFNVGAVRQTRLSS
jgi:hypothetical protein